MGIVNSDCLKLILIFVMRYLAQTRPINILKIMRLGDMIIVDVNNLFVKGIFLEFHMKRGKVENNFVGHVNRMSDFLHKTKCIVGKSHTTLEENCM